MNDEKLLEILYANRKASVMDKELFARGWYQAMKNIIKLIEEDIRLNEESPELINIKKKIKQMRSKAVKWKW